jgi:hypothetical protein
MTRAVGQRMPVADHAETIARRSSEIRPVRCISTIADAIEDSPVQPSSDPQSAGATTLGRDHSDSA